MWSGSALRKDQAGLMQLCNVGPPQQETDMEEETSRPLPQHSD